MSELAYLGLAEAADLIRARKLSPVEYTQALLERTEKLDPRFHAYIKLTPERAMEARAPGRARGDGRHAARAPARRALWAQGHHRRRGAADHRPLQGFDRQRRDGERAW